MSAETILMQLKHEIIKRWFVPIYNKQLKCYIRIIDGDGEVSIEKKDLDTIPELHHKIEILDWYNNGMDDGDKRFKCEKIEVKLPVLTKSQLKKAAKIYGKKIGHRQNKANLDLVVRVLSEDEASFDGFLDEEGIGTVNRVALVRNKGMIVNHYPYQGRYKQDFIALASERKFEAILFAGKMCINEHTEEEENHLEMFLSYAENPAHNEWIDDAKDIKRCNLKRFEERPTPFPVSRVRGIFNRIYSIISDFFPKDDKPPVKKEICSFWRKLYKLPSAGDCGGGEAGFSYETLQEGFDSEGRYSWKLKVKSLNSEKKLKLTFAHYLNSLEGPIKKVEEFSNLGVPEFEELHISENGVPVDKVVLEYDNVAEEGIPKEIEIKTCRITGNNKFKNMDPVLEIKDSITT